MNITLNFLLLCLLCVHLVSSTNHGNASQSTRQESDKDAPERGRNTRAATGRASTDLTDYPDVIFLIQKGGLKDQDFRYVKSFIKNCARRVRGIGSQKEKSRFAVTLFSAMAQHLVEFAFCCGGGIGTLDMYINRMFIFDDDAPRLFDKKNHPDLSREWADLKYGLKAVKEKHMTDKRLPKHKPIVLFIILNFQTPKMTFNVLNDAAIEVKKIKDMGIHIVTIIVDELENRQPRLLPDVTSSKHKSMKGRTETKVEQQHPEITEEFAESLMKYLNPLDHKDTKEQEYLSKLIEKYRSEVFSEMKGIAMFNEPRLMDDKIFNDLVLNYAQAIASTPEHGIKIGSYRELSRSDIETNMTGIVGNPMSWYGVGQVETNCRDTKNLIEQTIWSPGYYTTKQYPNGVECTWKISVSLGNYVSLRFDKFITEPTFDRVVVYDGHDTKTSRVLGEYSGQLTRSKPLTIKSSVENMMLFMQTDGGNSEVGFLAKWEPLPIHETINNVSIVYLVDVSGSMGQEDLVPITDWIEKGIPYFSTERTNIDEEDVYADNPYLRLSVARMWQAITRDLRRKKRDVEDLESRSCRFGLVSFASKAKILNSIVSEEATCDLSKSLTGLNVTRDPTYLGRALDFSRLKQFLVMLGEEAFMPRKNDSSNSNSTDDNEIIPRRAIFIFSDWHSVDDPRPAIKRLCSWHIIPVLIGIGVPNLQAREDLLGECGLAFSIKTPMSEVISSLKNIWQYVKKPEATTPMPTAEETTQQPTTGIATTTSTTPTTTTESTEAPTYPYTGTYPTLPPTTVKLPTPDDFNYYGVAGLLIAIGYWLSGEKYSKDGFTTLPTKTAADPLCKQQPIATSPAKSTIETIGLALLISYYYSSAPPLPTLVESSMSLAKERIKKEIKEFKKLPRPERIQIAREKVEEAKEFEKLKSKEKKKLKKRESRYPQAVNSFFTRNMVLREHLKEKKKSEDDE